MLKPFLKLIGFFAVITLYLLKSILSRLLYADSHQRRQMALDMTSTFSQLILKLLSVEVEERGAFSKKASPHLIVANHLSDIDVLILASLRPAVFVTSVEVRETRFLGALARAAGSCFVERRNRQAMDQESEEITAILREGFDVVLFAEGTSSSGEKVLPFHSAFFGAGIQSEAWLQPACIEYLRVNSEPLTAHNRDSILYYGDMGFGKHLWRLCQNYSVLARCTWLAARPLLPSDSRKVISKAAQSAIADAFRPVTSPHVV